MGRRIVCTVILAAACLLSLFSATAGSQAAKGLFEAMEKAGTLDTEKVRDALADLQWDCLGVKNVRFGGEKHYGTKRHIIYDAELITIKGGKIESVAYLTPEEVGQFPPFK